MKTINIQMRVEDHEHDLIVKGLLNRLNQSPIEGANVGGPITGADMGTPQSIPNPIAAPVTAPVTAPVAAPVTDAELDSAGVPWNPEFHTKTKTKIAAGTWRLQKGVDKNAFEAYAAQYTTQPAPVADVVQAPQVTPAAIPQAAPVIQETAAPMEMPDIPQALQRVTPEGGLPMASAPPPAVPPTVSYDDMMGSYNAAQERIGADALIAQIPTLYQQSGVSDPAEFSTNETARASLKALLDSLQPAA